MANSRETFLAKISSYIPGSNALPGWGLIGVIYWFWFYMHPENIALDLGFTQIPVQENYESFALIATGVTYYLADLLDDIFWKKLKPKWTDKYTSETDSGGFKILEILEISEGSYRVSSSLLAAAKEDFIPKSINEVAKACRSLAVMALFYAVVPTIGTAREIYADWWRFIAIMLAAALGLWFYPNLKGLQILRYYELTRQLINNQNRTIGASIKLINSSTADQINAEIEALKKSGFISNEFLKTNAFESLTEVEKRKLLIETFQSEVKYQTEVTRFHRLFFWDGVLITSARNRS